MASNRIKGITIEIGGDTTKLDKALAGTDKQLRATQTNLKDVERLLKMDPGNTDLLAQKQRLLSQALAESGDRAKILREAMSRANEELARDIRFKEKYAPLLQSLDEATEAYKKMKDEKTEMDHQLEAGTISTEEYDKWNDKTKEIIKTYQDLSKKVAAAKKEMGGPMMDQEQFDALQREFIETEQAVKKAEKSVKSFSVNSAKMDTAFSKISDKAGKLSSTLAPVSKTILGIGAAIAATVPATEDLRVATGKLTAAFESAGYNAEIAQGVFTDFYKILGDTDTAAEASQLLANMSNQEESLAYLTGMLTDEYGVFAGSIPIEALVQAANEAVRTGEVTGILAETIERAGGNAEKLYSR